MEGDTEATQGRDTGRGHRKGTLEGDTAKQRYVDCEGEMA